VILATAGSPTLPWWADRLLVPVVFVLLGAAITFATGQITARRERHRAKRAFLQAIRLELRGLEEQLQASLKDLQASKERLDRNVADPPPYLVGMLRTTVFTSQLGKLSDLSDPLVYEVIKLYSEIPVLLEIIEVLNQNSKELARDDGSAQQARRMKAVASIVTALILQGDGFIGKIRNLVEKLPA
jgi:hypothetical protein